MNTQIFSDTEMLEAEERGRSLADYLVLFKKHWIWLVAGMAVCGVTAFFYVVSTPDTYEATSLIMVEKVEKQDNVDKSKELVMSSWSVEDDYFGTQVAFLTSNKILGKAVSEASLPDGVQVVPLNSAEAQRLSRSSVIEEAVVYKVSAKRLVKSRLIALTVNGPDPAICAKLANAVSDVYLRENAMQNLFISKQMYKWLEDDGRGIESMGPDQRGALADSMQSVINDPELLKLRANKEAVLNQLREFSMRYRPKHPRIKELSHSLDELDKSIDTRREMLISNIRSSLSGLLNVTNVRILDPAVEPAYPSGPDRPVVILGGIVGGAAAGALLVILLELMNQKVRTRQDLPTSSATVYLGAIPKIGLLDRLKAKGSVETSTYVKILNDNLELRDAVVGIRTHILFSTTYEKTKRVMFVNSVAEEGKSTVAILIALSLASMGRKILLIEADLRQPSIAGNLGLGSSLGLSDVLNGETDIRDAVRKVPGAALDVLPGGTPTNQSSGLLASTRFDQLLEHLGGQYDRIILIAPPILNSPDSMIVAKNISCGILVCAAGLTDREAVRESQAMFLAMKRPLVGIVINKLNQANSIYKKSGGGAGEFINKHIHLRSFPGAVPESRPIPDPAKTIKQN